MNAHETTKRRAAASHVGGMLAWLGGGYWLELGERYERSNHAVAGAVVLLGAALAWLVATMAVSESSRWSLAAVIPLTLVFSVLIGVVIRGIAGGSDQGRLSTAGRAAVAAAVGVVVGDLAALVVFSSSIDRGLDERALRVADSTPAVVQASASLQQKRDARRGLDNAVELARANQDRALVVARCEYNPTPGCPQTRITGVPGVGPEARTANELLADAQRELANALAVRDRQAPALDAEISRREQTVAEARHSALAGAREGLGARWVAMNDVTLAAAGALTLRLLIIAAFVLVYLLPLALLRWRGETTHERQVTARTARERAELDADTAIAVKRAQVRREAEIMWAEHQLTQARLAIEAQTEIDREQQRRRVVTALQSPAQAKAERRFEAVANEMYLPIAAEAEAASLAITQSSTGAADADAKAARKVDNLPATVEAPGQVEPHDDRGAMPMPSVPQATRAASRWIRPLVPPFVARVIDTTTQPLRTARQVFEEVFEEVEEITFSFKRTHKVTLASDTSEAGDQASGHSAEHPYGTDRVASAPTQRPSRSARRAGSHALYPVLPPTADEADGLSLGPSERDHMSQLTEREAPRELRSPDGPRELPPPK